MVAVRMRTAGQPALRRNIFSTGPGIDMSGAAACASGSASASQGVPADLALWTRRRVFDRSLHPCRTRIRPQDAALAASLHFSSYRLASRLHTGLALPLPDSLEALARRLDRPCRRLRLHARVWPVQLVSGMDIADRNGGAVVASVAGPALPAWCEAVLSASDRGVAAMRVFADCLTGRHMSYNAPAASCAWVICQPVDHRGGGRCKTSPVVHQTKLAKNCVSTQNRRHGREQ